jgi:predicted ATP-dependent serine protease
VPQKLRGLLGGFFAGQLIAKNPLAAIGIGYVGYKKSKELTDDEKEVIREKLLSIEERIQELRGEQQGEGIMSANQLGNMRFPTYKLNEKWEEFMGNPSKNFHAIVFGTPKSGKSIFCMRLADYLSTNLGSVLYIASEEGFGHTLKEKIDNWASGGNGQLDFGNFKGFESIALNCKDRDFVIIDSINYANITVEELEELKELYPRTAFITVLQATKEGNFRGSQEYAHNCDIVIKVDAGIAKQKGRFQAESSMKVFEK